MHGISPETTPFIPVSGLKGDNIVYDSYHMPWFQGWKTSRLSGKTFIDAINSTQLPMPDLVSYKHLKKTFFSIKAG